MSAPIVERLRDVHHTDFATRLEAADTITDLLAALESAEVHFAKFARTKFQHEAVAKMRAAIAKAKAGQP